MILLGQEKKAYKASEPKKELNSLFQPGQRTPRSAATPPAMAPADFAAMPYMNPSFNPMMAGIAPTGMADPMAMFGNGLMRPGGSAVLI